MSIPILLAFALAAGADSEPSLCSSIESKIEPDMQIRESDLGRPAATAAAGKLQDMIDRGQLGGEFQFGVLNQLKIVQGHVLLQQARLDRDEFGSGSPEAQRSKTTLCQWLSNEGFWYD
jgi:hypothetical protein